MAHAMMNTRDVMPRTKDRVTDTAPKCEHPHPHPKFDGQQCAQMLIESATRPWSAVCRRCGRKTTKR